MKKKQKNKRKKEKVISFYASKLNEMINVVYMKGMNYAIDRVEEIVFQSLNDGYDGIKNTVILEYLKDMRKQEELNIIK